MRIVETLKLLKGFISIEAATEIVMRYFAQIHHGLGLLSFKVGDARYCNDDRQIVKIDCSFYNSLGSKKRTSYRVHVHYIKGIISIEER